MMHLCLIDLTTKMNALRILSHLIKNIEENWKLLNDAFTEFVPFCDPKNRATLNIKNERSTKITNQEK